MKFELSKEECDTIIKSLYAMSIEEVPKDNAVSGGPTRMVGLSTEYVMGEITPSIKKIINKLKEHK